MRIKPRTIRPGTTVHLMNGGRVYAETKAIQPVPAAVVVETANGERYLAWDLVENQDGQVYADSYRRATR